MTDERKYLIFKISWFLLLLGIICDVAIYENISFFIFTLNIQTSSLVLIAYILVFFLIVPLKKINQLLTEKFDRNNILVLSSLLLTAFISSYLSDMRNFAIGTTIFRYALFFLCFICTLVYSYYFKNASRYIFKSFIVFNFFIILSSFADFYFPDFNRLLVTYFGHMEAKHSSLKINGINYIRPSGFVTDTNLTAFTLIFSCLLLLINLKQFRKKYLIYIFYLCAGYSFGMLASRSALIAVVASSILFFIFRYAERKEILIFFLLFFLVQLLTPQTQARLNQIFNKAYIEEEMGMGRLVIWKADILAFETSPVIGIGSGVFFKKSNTFLAQADKIPLSEFLKKYEIDVNTPNKGGINPHCIFLVMLCEYGVIGLIIFIVLLVQFTKGLVSRKLYISLIFLGSLLFVSSLSNYAPYYKYYMLICIIFYILSKNNMLINDRSGS